MEPYKGYAVKNTAFNSVVLVMPPAQDTNFTAVKTAQAAAQSDFFANWGVKFRTACEGMSDIDIRPKAMRLLSDRKFLFRSVQGIYLPKPRRRPIPAEKKTRPRPECERLRMTVAPRTAAISLDQ